MLTSERGSSSCNSPASNSACCYLASLGAVRWGFSRIALNSRPFHQIGSTESSPTRLEPLVALKIFLEKRRNPLHQINSPDGIARGMSPARKQHNLNILPALDRFIQNQHGVDKVNVVVPGPLPDHQLPLKTIHEIQRRSSPIPFRIILR